jgi:uncharacterized paraquat-inducible protein A
MKKRCTARLVKLPPNMTPGQKAACPKCKAVVTIQMMPVGKSPYHILEWHFAGISDHDEP